MHRMGVLRRGGSLLLLAVMGVALGLGGCNKNRKATEAANTEAAELRERIATLEESNRQKDAQLADAANRGGFATDTGDNGPAPRNTGGTRSRNRPAGITSDEGSGGRVLQSDGRGRAHAEISGDVLFSPGSADVKTDAKKTLDKVASEIKRDYAGANIRVEGYTDSDPLKKAKAKWGTNEKLSQARADAVKQYLATKGVKSSRIESMGFGSAKPKATKAQSRRVEILVVQ